MLNDRSALFSDGQLALSSVIISRSSCYSSTAASPAFPLNNKDFMWFLCESVGLLKKQNYFSFLVFLNVFLVYDLF